MINKFLNYIKSLLKYNKIINELENLVNQYSNELIKALSIIKKQDEKIQELKILKDAAETTLKELINTKKIEVSSLESWYENKFGTIPWFYDYDGDGRKDVRTAFRYEDEEEGPKIIRNLSKSLIQRYSIKNPSKERLIEIVKEYFTIRNNWTYVTDKQLWNKLEFWPPVDVSASIKKGDCDALALLMHMLILDLFEIFKYEKHSWRLKLAAGRVIGEGGHAYNIWLADDGEWYVIESTYDLSGSFRRTWLKTPIKYNNLYVDFWGFARPDRSFRGNNILSLEAYRHDEAN